MKIQLFDGGLNTRLAPQLIQQTQGTVYENIDNSTGVLAPVASPKDSGIDVAKDHVYIESLDEWFDFARPTDSVEYNSVLYFTDGVDTPKKYDGSDVSLLGVIAPSSVGKQTIIPAPAVVKSVDADVVEVELGQGIKGNELHYYIVNTKAGAASNALYIKVTKDKVETIETSASELVYPTIADATPKKDLEVTFSNIKAKLEEDGVEVYRYYDGKWFFVNKAADDKVIFVDDTDNIGANRELTDDKFANLQGVYQYVMTYYDKDKGIESGPSPLTDELDMGEEGGAIIFSELPVSTDPQVDEKRLYRIGGELTEFSLVDTIPNADTSYTDNLGDTEIDGAVLTTDENGVPPIGLRFITEAYAMLWGALGSRLYFTPIGEPNNWPALYFIEFGREITGIAPVGSGIIVFGRTKAELVIGTGPTTLTRTALAGDQGCVSHNSIQLMGTSALWVSTDGICVSSGGPVQVLSKMNLGPLNIDVSDSALHDQVYYVLDARTNRMLAVDFRYSTIFKTFDLPISQVSVGSDRLYGWREGRLLELFAGDTPTTFRYSSPRFVEGRATQSKLYKNVYFYAKGDIIIKMYIDNILVQTKRTSGEDNFELKVPVSDKRGHSVHFEVEGTGELSEIYYEADV